MPRRCRRKNAMKKTGLKWLERVLCLLVLAALIFGIMVLRAIGERRIAWQRVDEAAAALTDADAAVLPSERLTLLGQELTPYCVQRTVCPTADQPHDLIYRLAEHLTPQKSTWSGQWEAEPTPQALQTTQTSWQLTLPQGAAGTLTVQDETGAAVFDGAVQETYTRTYSAPGTDTCRLTLQVDTSQGQDICLYEWTVTLPSQTEVEVLNETPQQGDVVPVVVRGNLFGEEMSLQTELGLCAFVPLEAEGEYAAFVPVAYNRSSGDWPITATVGDRTFETVVSVQEREFPVQYMTIDQDIADSTWNSAAASSEYRAAIYPLYEVADTVRYWDGLFLEPVTGYRVSTQYGLWRYTNGVYSERHGGVDMACARGTTVSAPQNGEILFAGYLQLTGNTVVLSHGGGVQSMFYHMDSLNVVTGDRVQTGQKIGEVGSTGYSTGPHLHYEVKIGSQSIDPFALFDGTSGLYAEQSIAGAS